MNYIRPPKQAKISPKRLVLTATDITAPVVMPVALLTSLALEAEAEILDWNKFFSRLMNPSEVSTSEDVVWVILLQIEDWDHFLEHAKNPAVAPSFEFLERKFSELIYLLDSIGNHLAGRLIVGLLPPPDEVSQNAGLMEFRDKLCKVLQESLIECPSIWVRNIPKQPLWEDASYQADGSESDSRVVYRIPISTRTLKGEQ